MTLVVRLSGEMMIQVKINVRDWLRNDRCHPSNIGRALQKNEE